LIVLVVAVPAAEARPAKKHKKQAPAVTVMTRNIYLGGNIFHPIGAQTLPEFERLAGELWTEVQHTDFVGTRAKLIAAEIKRTKPDLVGLQEVAVWRRGPDGVQDGATTPSTQVVYDFLAALRTELRKAGLKYSVAGNQQEADIEAPIDAGYDIRLTMHDVVLVKKSRDLKVTKTTTKNYKTTIGVPTPAGTLTSTRGWVAVDATLKGKKFRFVDTHLESAAESTRTAQARELVSKSGPLRVKKPVILVGDMNSDPEGRESDSNAFDVLHGFGLIDTWPTIHKNDEGFSCCLVNSDLSDTNTAGFNHRIDLILTRPKLKGLSGVVVGKKLSDRAANGLWPSDHAGVVEKLRLR
jgi:endonuclease/exonuclease/phosphatase family metal-dependent hydrolase